MPIKGDRIIIQSKRSDDNERQGIYLGNRAYFYGWVLLDGDKQEKYFANSSIHVLADLPPSVSPIMNQRIMDVIPVALPLRITENDEEKIVFEDKISRIRNAVTNIQAELEIVLNELSKMTIQQSF
jgi:hypothetical protein